MLLSRMCAPAGASLRSQRRHDRIHIELHNRQHKSIWCRAAAEDVPAAAAAEGAPAAAAHLLDRFARHDLEGIIPYISELAVVRAAIRQHETATAWARRAAAWPAPEPAAAPIPQSPCPTAPYNEAVESSDGDYAWDGRMFVEGVPVTAGPPASSPQLPPHSIPQLGAPDFAAVLDAAQSSRGTAGPLLDSAALRHLVLSRPARLEPLSAVSLGPDTYVERISCTSPSGERVVLTLRLRRRAAAELASGYSKQPHKQPWVLERVSGEPVNLEPITAISPVHPPEAVVAASVAAFQGLDFDAAYTLTSPVGRAVAGSRERFRAALLSDPRYAAVLGHTRACSVHRTHSNASTYLEVLHITGADGASGLFIWVATRQLDGLYRDCWLVEYTTPIIDADVIKALQLSH